MMKKSTGNETRGNQTATRLDDVELPKKSIAAIRELRKRQIEESRAKHGPLFSLAEIKAIAAQVDQKKAGSKNKD